MKLIIFGATGTVGIHLVRQALLCNYDVTAFTRFGHGLSEFRNTRLSVRVGDVLDAAIVASAIRGHDAVMVALGAGRKGDTRAKGTLNILKGMEENGVRRLVCQTTLGAGESWNNLNFFWKRIMFGWFLKEAFLDHELQERYVEASGLDWTIVRPGAFTDGNMTGAYKHGFPSSERSLTLKISRADVAHFMLSELSTNQYLRKAPGLSY